MSSENQWTIARTFRTPDGAEIMIGAGPAYQMPADEHGPGNWCCPWTVQGIGDASITSQSYGFDSWQATELAMGRVTSLLERHTRERDDITGPDMIRELITAE